MNYSAKTEEDRLRAEQYLQGSVQKRQPGMLSEIVQAFQLQQTMLQMESQYNKPIVQTEGKIQMKPQNAAPLNDSGK